MVERNIGLSLPKVPNLLVSEEKQLTDADIIAMFGANYRKLIEDTAVKLGINEKLNFFDSPLSHKGSQAVYIVEQFIGDHLFLVPVLQKDMATSQHHHEAPMRREIYFHVAGESVVYIGEDEKPRDLNERQPRIEIPLGVLHQVKAPKSPALTVIIMEDARLAPSGRLHVRRKSSLLG